MYRERRFVASASTRWLTYSILAASSLAACRPASAQTQRFSADATLSAGASSNPFLRPGNASSSAFVELGLNPRYQLVDELGSTTIGGSYRRTEYLTGYDASEAYGGEIQSQRKLTEQLGLRALLAFDSSILGERGSDLLIPLRPVEPGPPLPPEVNPDLALFGLGQRRSTLRAGLGADFQRTEIDVINADVQVERASFGSEQSFSDYRAYSGALGYARSLSERTQVGARVSAQFIDYDLRGSTSSVLQPQLTIDTQLSSLWSLKAAAGLLFVTTERTGESSDSIGLSTSVTGCRRADRSSLCLRLQRDASPSGLGEVLTRTGGGIDYSYRLGERTYVRAQADISHVAGSTFADRDSLTYGNVSATYDRELSKRLSGGVTVAYRDVYGLEQGVSADVSSQLFVRARLGSVQ